MSGPRPARNLPLAAAAALALSLAALTAGCGGSKPAAATLVCPKVAAGPALDSIALFAPGGGRQVQAGGKITAAQGTCQAEPNGIAVNTEISINALRAGPQIQAATLPYFVAVADLQEQILVKQSFELTVAFLPGQNYRTSIEKITVHIPARTPAAGGEYRVIVGFQLTPDQLAYNRAQPPQ